MMMRILFPEHASISARGLQKSSISVFEKKQAQEKKKAISHSKVFFVDIFCGMVFIGFPARVVGKLSQGAANMSPLHAPDNTS